MACALVPLDEQQVTEPSLAGKERTLPALHPDRKEERCFVPYKPPPEDGSPAQVEEFLEHAKFITEDLEWLLALPHDKFWCQVVFDESLQKCLDSYLCHASRGLDPAGLPCSPAVADAQRCIHRAVFMTFLRMATHKESKENFLTPSVFGEIIYENFLFDIPKILDLCVLFGKGNTQLLHKMIENIFTQQPGYYSDLDETVSSVLQDLVDLILYLCDSTTTIHAFLDIYPPACSTFQAHSFLSRLVLFYESAVPDIEKAVRKRNFTDKSLKDDLWRRMCHSCKRMVEVAHLLLQHSCLQPILEGFLSDYDEQFPVADDISLLQQALPLIDETRTSYLLQGVQSAWDSVGRARPQGYMQNANALSAAQGGAMGGRASPLGVRESGEGGETPRGAEAPLFMPHKGNNGAVCVLSAGELESLLSSIRELLPDLGEGFLLACLQEYDYSSELVINNILEDRLAPGLDKLDRAMPRQPKEELPAVLSNRSNVFDDDEFDVFHRDQHIEEQRDRYRAYDMVADEVMVQPGAAYTLDEDYDDEYDDTYDVNQVGANDLDGDSLLSRRPFTMPLVLRTAHKPQFEQEDEEEEDASNMENQAPRDQFIQEPGGAEGAGRGDEGSHPTEEGSWTAFHEGQHYRPEPAGHVMGKPKGQGQTQETTQDRRKKEANKGRGANHNRRNMADRKRNKGMIPS
ncbi:hypothetical protein CRUP_022966 [Coryphaenoides rupestris]|nr:hypothetical protein CRUP_022966 [Coryphaenoides rupestris]